MAIIISVVNQKGGVGKTTTSVNLGAGLADRGKRVLLVDIDAQANCSAHLGISVDEDESAFSIYDVLVKNKPIDDAIIHVDDLLYLIPASLLLSAADLELGGVIGRELLLKKALNPIDSRFDYIIIDCPPTLGLLSLNGLVASAKVILPVQSQFLALHGVRQLLDTVEQVRSAYNPSLSVGGVLLCMHDARLKLSKTVASTVKEYFGDLVFKTVIRSNVALAEAPARGVSIFGYDQNCNGAEDYGNLAEEVIERDKKTT